MKHPNLNYQRLEDILNLIPKGTPWIYVLYTYILTALKKNKGNRTHTANDIKMPLRSLRWKLSPMESLGFKIPESHTSEKFRK